MGEENQNNQQPVVSSAPPPRFGPNPNPPSFSVEPEPITQPKKHKGRIWFVIIALILIAGGVAGYFLWPKKAPIVASGPSAQASNKLAPSLIGMAKGSESWQNGHFLIMGGHGLPDVNGTFIKTDDGQFYMVADVDQTAVQNGINELTNIVGQPQTQIYTGLEYQADTLGLLNQIGYGLDANLFDFLEELVELAGDANAQKRLACTGELTDYYAETGKYLSALQPNYVFDSKYQSHQWRLDTIEVFNNLSVKAKSPACYDFFDTILANPVESEKLAGTQLIFETTEETPDGAVFKVFAAPPLPSENFEFFFKMTISGVNKTEPPSVYTSDPVSIFSRNSTFALSLSQCAGLPVIAQSIGGLPKYASPDQPDQYKGPQLHDLGYYCSAADAEADGYQKL